MKIRNLLTTMTLTAALLLTAGKGWGQENISNGVTITEGFDAIGTSATATLPTS